MNGWLLGWLQRKREIDPLVRSEISHSLSLSFEVALINDSTYAAAETELATTSET